MRVVPVGIDHEPVECNEAIRTPEQLEAMMQIVTAPEFDFACFNPFDIRQSDNLDGYRGYFMFAWYDKQDQLHLDRIDPNGSLGFRHIGDENVIDPAGDLKKGSTARRPTGIKVYFEFEVRFKYAGSDPNRRGFRSASTSMRVSAPSIEEAVEQVEERNRRWGGKEISIKSIWQKVR